MPRSDFIDSSREVLDQVGSPPFLRKLGRFRLGVHQALARRPGSNPASRATQANGLEMANYKTYTPGDDLRHFDWNAYMRLGQKVIKTFRAEQEAPLHLLIDTSASMGVPKSDGKLPLAVGVAASLAYVSLRQQDPVCIVGVGKNATGATPFYRHPSHFGEIRAALARLQASGPTLLTEGIVSYLRTARLPGLAIVLSDFLVHPDIYERTLGALLERRYAVAALRLIGPLERDPSDLRGRIRLHDAETGTERIVDLSDAHRARYRSTLRDHLTGLSSWCASHGVTYGLLCTDDGIEVSVLRGVPGVGILQ
jgi:uncharacterized protein (DUF58 family)